MRCGWMMPEGIWQLHVPVPAGITCAGMPSCARWCCLHGHGAERPLQRAQAGVLPCSALLNSPILYCFAVTVVSCFFSTSKTQQVWFADLCLALYAPK